MKPTFKIKRNDREPSILAVLKQGGLPMNLTGCSVRFLMRSNVSGTTLKVDAAANIVDPVAGTVRYDWAGVDTDTEGHYIAEWEITKVGGKKISVPTDGYLQIFVTKDLG